MNQQTKDEQTCCKPFDPLPWNDQFIEWENKKFVKTNVCTAFYMPLNFGSKMRSTTRLIDKSGAQFVDEMALSTHPSAWKMGLYLAVDKTVEGIDNTTLSGRFYARVYDGPFKDTDKWMKNFADVAKGKGLNIAEWYMWYTTCPKCAKKYGHNYVVIFGKIS